MGVVYLAEHAVIGRLAAVKLLLPAMSESADAVKRFFNEARATARISHPGIVEILDCGQMPNGQAYIVMEYLAGETLGAYGNRRGKLSGDVDVDVARALIRQVALALAAAHARGIIHRDLKPDNVFLTADSGAADVASVKILDFGIAKLVQTGKAPVITHTKELLGTPVYISPEQCKGAKTLDHRTDIYSLGCIAFEMLTGHPVFHADSLGELIASHMFKEAPDLLALEPTVPPAFGALVLRMLAKAPDARPSTMNEVAAAIDAEGVPASLRGDTVKLPSTWPLDLSLPEEPVLGHGMATVSSSSGASLPIQTQSADSTFTSLASETSAGQAARAARPRAWVGLAIGAALFAGGVWFIAGRAPPRAPAAAVLAVSPVPAAPTSVKPIPAPTVAVDVEDAPRGLEVIVDGRPAAVPVKLARGSAVHTVVFRAPGYAPMTRSLDGTKDRTLVLEMSRVPAQIPARPGGAAAPKAPAKTARQPHKRTTDLFLDL